MGGQLVEGQWKLRKALPMMTEVLKGSQQVFEIGSAMICKGHVMIKNVLPLKRTVIICMCPMHARGRIAR